MIENTPYLSCILVTRKPTPPAASSGMALGDGFNIKIFIYKRVHHFFTSTNTSQDIFDVIHCFEHPIVYHVVKGGGTGLELYSGPVIRDQW